MLFLLTVVLVAVKLGRGPGVLAAFVSVASFDFFFVPPRLSFAVTDFQYLLTLAVMLVVALITAHMTAGLGYQARVASLLGTVAPTWQALLDNPQRERFVARVTALETTDA